MYKLRRSGLDCCLEARLAGSPLDIYSYSFDSTFRNLILTAPACFECDTHGLAKSVSPKKLADFRRIVEHGECAAVEWRRTEKQAGSFPIGARCRLPHSLPQIFGFGPLISFLDTHPRLFSSLLPSLNVILLPIGQTLILEHP